MARKRAELSGPASPHQTPFQQMVKYMLGQASSIQGLGLHRQPSGNTVALGLSGSGQPHHIKITSKNLFLKYLHFWTNWVLLSKLLESVEIHLYRSLFYNWVITDLILINDNYLILCLSKRIYEMD